MPINSRNRPKMQKGERAHSSIDTFVHSIRCMGRSCASNASGSKDNKKRSPNWRSLNYIPPYIIGNRFTTHSRRKFQSFRTQSWMGLHIAAYANPLSDLYGTRWGRRKYWHSLAPTGNERHVVTVRKLGWLKGNWRQEGLLSKYEWRGWILTHIIFRHISTFGIHTRDAESGRFPASHHRVFCVWLNIDYLNIFIIRGGVDIGRLQWWKITFPVAEVSHNFAIFVLMRDRFTRVIFNIC